MIGQFHNKKLWKYPRMGVYDAQLWEKYIIEHGGNFDSFDYDLKVGSGVTPPFDIDQKFIKDYEELSKKRIDAVGYKNNFATIFEVKPRAGLSALGQLLSYRDLFIQSFPSIIVQNLALVTSLITPEERLIYINNNIIIYVYPAT